MHGRRLFCKFLTIFLDQDKFQYYIKFAYIRKSESFTNTVMHHFQCITVRAYEIASISILLYYIRASPIIQLISNNKTVVKLKIVSN